MDIHGPICICLDASLASCGTMAAAQTLQTRLGRWGTHATPPPPPQTHTHTRTHAHGHAHTRTRTHVLNSLCQKPHQSDVKIRQRMFAWLLPTKSRVHSKLHWFTAVFLTFLSLCSLHLACL